MHRFLKLIHLVGVALFVGSVGVHLLSALVGTGGTGAAPGAPQLEQTLRVLRALTLPGLALMGLSGSLMMVRAKLSPMRTPWLGAHAGMAAVAGVLTVAVLLPACIEAATAAAATPGADSAGLSVALSTFRVAGWVAAALALGAMGLAVFKPQWRRRAGS